MKTIKNKIPAIICTTAIFTTNAFSNEFIIAKSESAITNTTTPTKLKVITDPAITTITTQLLQPIRLQAKRANRFSRRSYTPHSTYNLVEITSSHQHGARFFNIMITPPKTKSSAFQISKQKLTQGKITTADSAPKPTVHLNIKYLTAANKILIKQDHQWVEKSNHKYLKLLPVVTHKVVAKKIVSNPK